MSAAIDRLKRLASQAPDSLAEEIEQGIAQMTRDPLLTQRHHTHGSFEENAEVAQRLKAFFRVAPGWERLTNVEREAMDMIALKFSRILSGKSMERQHWEDVAGYAKLVEERCG